MEERRRGIEGRGIAGTQLAVDFDQGLLWGLDRIALQRLADHRAYVIALREEQVHLNHARVEDLRKLVGSELGVGLEEHFAGGGIHDVARSPRAFKIAHIHFDLADLCLLNVFKDGVINFAAGMRDLIARFGLDAVCQLHANQVCGLLARGINRPVKLLVADQ